MHFDDLLHHYFGTTDLSALSPEALADGVEQVKIAFGTERELGRRFALWVLLDALGAAPFPADAFEDPAQRRAAEDYLDAMGRLSPDSG